MRKVQEEVDRVLQGRLPTYEDIKNLKFLTHCIIESMRLYPHPPVICKFSFSIWLNVVLLFPDDCFPGISLGLVKKSSSDWHVTWELQGQCWSRYHDFSIQYSSLGTGITLIYNVGTRLTTMMHLYAINKMKSKYIYMN